VINLTYGGAGAQFGNTGLTADIRRFFIDLAVSEAQLEAIPRPALTKLRHLVWLLANRASAYPSAHEYTPDPSHPGYLLRAVKSYFVFVPFNLARFFANDDVLDALIVASKTLAVDDASPICISGSATLLRNSAAIADLDFCEYYLSPKRDMPALLSALWIREIADFVLISARVVSMTYQSPWPAYDTILQDSIELSLASVTDPDVMLDGVYASHIFGVLPASNKVLPIDVDNVETGSALKSFVFQEAVIVSIATPPRSLVNAEQLGRYLNFLRCQAEEWLHKDPLKSLKRSLAFFRLTDFDDPAELIADVLESDLALLVMTVKRQRNLDEIRSRCAASQLHRIAETGPRIPNDVIAYAEAFNNYVLGPMASNMLTRISEAYADVR
jgi:hypothetical protein